jgi:hypothetical protein
MLFEDIYGTKEEFIKWSEEAKQKEKMFDSLSPLEKLKKLHSDYLEMGDLNCAAIFEEKIKNLEQVGI